MIGYITLGTNDMEKAAYFYDELLVLLGGKRFMESEGFIAWSTGPGQPAVSIIKPYNGQAASVGNGNMVALAARSPEQVDMIHAKALELGGTDEGEPGERFDGFYAGYFRDTDGNKLNCFCMTGSSE